MLPNDLKRRALQLSDRLSAQGTIDARDLAARLRCLATLCDAETSTRAQELVHVFDFHWFRTHADAYLAEANALRHADPAPWTARVVAEMRQLHDEAREGQQLIADLFQHGWGVRLGGD